MSVASDRKTPNDALKFILSCVNCLSVSSFGNTTKCIKVRKSTGQDEQRQIIFSFNYFKSLYTFCVLLKFISVLFTVHNGTLFMTDNLYYFYLNILI